MSSRLARAARRPAARAARLLGRARTALRPDPGSLPFDEQYRLWLARRRPGPARLRAMRREVASWRSRPTVGLVVHVADADPDAVRRTARSVRAQVYPAWELRLAADDSARPETLTLLERLEREDRRVRVTHLAGSRSRARACNEALAASEADYLARLDAGGALRPEALFEAVRAAEAEAADVLYTDDDVLGPDGRVAGPRLKPAWSPDLLLSTDYVSGFTLYRSSLVERIGGFRPELEPAEDYDLALRATEAAARVAHAAVPAYTRPAAAARPLPAEAGARALEEALGRRGEEGAVEPGLAPGTFRVRRAVRRPPRVAIVVPTRDRVDLLRRCLESVRHRTAYPAYEVVVVDNDSRDPETLAYLARLPDRVLRHPGAFNFARMMNRAVQEATDAPLLVFLNNDAEVLEPGWLEAMVEHGVRPEVAAVGARLVDAGGRTCHAGIVIGAGGGLAANVGDDPFGWSRVVRDVSAVTAACMLVRRQVFEELGGFDERLGVAYNDVDLCLRARERGLLVVYTPHALLRHDERSSRGDLSPAEERALFRSRWGAWGATPDPYYNPNLSLRHPYRLEP
jgi:GT2 family glycosyltransferase